jgi:XRE family transcriptional regulator, regulator of sulfur utilization
MSATSRNPALALAFGQTVRAHRESMEVAQEWMALDSGIDRSYFGQIERGEKQPSLDLVFRIAAVLNITPETLVRRVRTRHEAAASAALAKSTKPTKTKSTKKNTVSPVLKRAR